MRRRATAERVIAENEKLIREIGIPRPFDLDVFVRERVADHRNQRMHVNVLPRGFPHKVPCGVWAVIGDDAYIFVKPTRSPHRHRHIVLHEVGHALRRPPQPITLDRDICALLFPGIPFEHVTEFMARTTYEADEEFAAEYFATQISVAIDASINPDAGKDLRRLEYLLSSATGKPFDQNADPHA